MMYRDEKIAFFLFCINFLFIVSLCVYEDQTVFLLMADDKWQKKTVSFILFNVINEEFCCCLMMILMTVKKKLLKPTIAGIYTRFLYSLPLRNKLN